MYGSLKGGGVSLVMQPLRAHQLAYEAEEYPAMNESTTGIDIVPLPTKTVHTGKVPDQEAA